MWEDWWNGEVEGGVLERVGGDSGEGEWEGGWLGRGKVGGRVG